MKNKTSFKPVRHTIGLDLGDVRHNICVLDRAGNIIEERTITNHRESLRRLAKKYPGARLALEVGCHSPWISRFLKELGLEVIVANARKLRAIYMNDRKSDELDAQMLAKIARVDPSLLYPIEHGSEEAQRDLLQIKLRDNLVRRRVDTISAVRFTLKSLGVRLPSPNTTCFAKRARTLLKSEHPELLAMIEPSLGVVDVLTASIRELDRAIEAMCQERYPQTALLRQIPGVGPITALCFVLVVGHPDRFSEVREVAAYLGLVPYLLGAFGAPSKDRIRRTAAANGYSEEWIDKALVGPALSAATGYMVDSYQWGLLSEVRTPQ